MALTNKPERAIHDIALSEASLALACAAAGRRRDAETWLHRAIASAERDLGSEHPALPSILERTANASFHLKDYETGRQRYEQAVALLARLHGSKSEVVFKTMERYESLLRDGKDKTRANDVKQRRQALMR